MRFLTRMAIESTSVLSFVAGAYFMWGPGPALMVFAIGLTLLEASVLDNAEQ